LLQHTASFISVPKACACYSEGYSEAILIRTSIASVNSNVQY